MSCLPGESAKRAFALEDYATLARPSGCDVMIRI